MLLVQYCNIVQTFQIYISNNTKKVRRLNKNVSTLHVWRSNDSESRHHIFLWYMSFEQWNDWNNGDLSPDRQVKPQNYKCMLSVLAAPVVFRKIKTFRGANGLFSFAFVSSFNQSPRVTRSAMTYAAVFFITSKSTNPVCVWKSVVFWFLLWNIWCIKVCTTSLTWFIW